MQTHYLAVRGLINDLLRSLSAALIHMDDLILKLDNFSMEYQDAWLINEQLQRSIEIFMALRSEAIIVEKINSDKDNPEIALNNFKQKSNQLLTTICRACDLIIMDKDHKQVMNHITTIDKCINNYFDVINNISNSEEEIIRPKINFNKLKE
jgi:hypothetical protein